MTVPIFLEFIVSALSVAGAAVIWRNWLEDHPGWKEWLQRRSYGKAFVCGSCFTYWLALASTLTVQPLEVWTPVHGNIFAELLMIILQWMALAWLSVFFRFAYVALQEVVSYQVHVLREHSH